MEDKVIVINNVDVLTCAIGSGRFLQVKDVQRNSLRSNTDAAFQSFQQTSQVEMPVNEVVMEPQLSNETIEIPQVVETPVETSIPVVEAPAETPVAVAEVPVVSPELSESVSMPVVEENISMEPSVVETPQESVVPVVENAPSNAVEIVSQVSTDSEYDLLMDELAKIDQECNQKIVDINAEREARKQKVLADHKQKIQAEKEQIVDFKTRAEEHLKNAQAAEQIATIAHQNAMNIASQTNVANTTVQSEIPFAPNITGLEDLSLSSQQVLAKIA